MRIAKRSLDARFPLKPVLFLTFFSRIASVFFFLAVRCLVNNEWHSLIFGIKLLQVWLGMLMVVALARCLRPLCWETGCCCCMLSASSVIVFDGPLAVETLPLGMTAACAGKAGNEALSSPSYQLHYVVCV